MRYIVKNLSEEGGTGYCILDTDKAELNTGDLIYRVDLPKLTDFWCEITRAPILFKEGWKVTMHIPILSSSNMKTVITDEDIDKWGKIVELIGNKDHLKIYGLKEFQRLTEEEYTKLFK